MFTLYATDYAPIDPVTPPCELSLIPIGYKGENLARCLVFDLTSCIEEFGDGGFTISFIRQGDEYPYLVTDTDRLDNNAIWNITSTDTAVDGYGLVQLNYEVDSVVCKSALYRTVTFDSNAITGDVPDPYEDLLAQVAAYAATAEASATTATAAANTASTAVFNGIKTESSIRAAADEGLQTQINTLVGLVGAPNVANTASAMTDSSSVYVYTGSEAGYTYGHWYYYNGTEWTDGGVYQSAAVDTDKTLTVSDMAADAAVTGHLIDAALKAFVSEETEGTVATFPDGADSMPVTNLQIGIEPVQSGSGDPSPTNIRPITGYTGAKIYKTRHNLWDVDAIVTSSNHTDYCYVDSDGYLRFVSGNAEDYGIWWKNISLPCPLRFSGTVKSFEETNAGAIRISFVFDDGTNYVCNYGSVAAGATATSSWVVGSEGQKVVRINSAWTSSRSVGILVADTQLEFGSTATDYEACSGITSCNVDWSDSAGTVYGGTLDVTTGILTVTYGVVDLSSLTWGYTDTYSCFIATSPSDSPTQKSGGYDTAVCSMYAIQTNVSLSNLSDYNLLLNSRSVSSSGKRVAIKDTRYTDADDFTTALTGQTLVYELEEPVSYQLTPTEVTTLLGLNNIWASTGDVESLIYRADTRLYIQHLTDPDTDMTADANIASGQYFMVNNTLYLATAAISSGATIVEGTNCTKTSLAAALNAINS